MAELSWLGNLWDSLTKREEKPTGNGILNYQPEIKPTEDVGLLGSILGPAGRTLQSAEAELPRSFVPSDPQYTPLVSESKFIYNKLLGEPIASLGEGLEGVAQGFGFVRGTEMGLPQLTQSGKQVVGGALEFAPVGAPLGVTARRGANVAAEAVERSPLGQGILGLQEQRGMGDGLLGAPRSQILAGPGSATADRMALLKANQLESEGSKPVDIWKETGWYKDVDQNWKYEIPDAQWKPGEMPVPEDVRFKGVPKIGPTPGTKLSDVLAHKRLYDAYPEAKDIEIVFDPEVGDGAFFQPNKTLDSSRIVVGNSIFDNERALMVLLHEAQHAVQSVEGFAAGGSSRKFLRELVDEKNVVMDRVQKTNEAMDRIVKEKDALRSQGIGENDPRMLDLSSRYRDAINYRSDLIKSFPYWDSFDMNEEAYKRYLSLAGEVEARNVERRARNQGLLSVIPTETTAGNVPKGYQSVDIGYQIMESDPKGLLGQDYRGVHVAPTKEQGTKNTLDDLSDIYPEDVYDPRVSAQYYGHTGAGDPMDRRSAELVAAFQGKPDAEVTIYRAVPKGVKEINKGDWVTLNKNYAESHGKSWVGEYDIISKKVKARDIISDGNSIHEFGYDPD